MNQLKDLLRHEILDLQSAEDQIIEALPKMIDKATNGTLKNSLQQHLEVTEEQRLRLNEVLLKLDGKEKDSSEDGNEKGNIFSSLFKKEKQECKGMKGLLSEGEKIMAEEMDPDVMDAAIIASAQKVEHYEICAYGTVRAYAQELNLDDVEELLRQTLDEEYEADDLLTQLAVGRVNIQAIGRSRVRKSRKKSNAGPMKKTSAKKTTRTTAAKRVIPAKKKTKTRSRSKSR